jgi:hypothetical protein
MATKATIDKLATRIEALANRLGAPSAEPQVIEVTIVHADRGRFAPCCVSGTCSEKVYPYGHPTAAR